MSITLLIILIVVLLLISPLLESVTIRMKGKGGEANVSYIISQLPTVKYITFNDLILQNNYGGTTQIDHVVVSRYGIFVIETKNYKGLIYGNDNSETWTQNIYGNKYKLYNPVRQNNTHIRVLKSVLSGFERIQFISIITFSPKASLRVTATSVHVVYWPQVYNLIISYKEEKISESDISKIAATLESARLKEKGSRNRHSRYAHAASSKKASEVASGYCPRCGHALILRKGKYGYFYGCSNYPDCKFTVKQLDNFAS